MNDQITELQLMRKAVVLFPRSAYTNPADVRHARRKWLQSVAILRSTSRGWVHDGKVGWRMSEGKQREAA